MSSKGIGRKVLRRHGWSDGQGLGTSVGGIAEALESEGQDPKDKRGFGLVSRLRLLGYTRTSRARSSYFHGTVCLLLVDDFWVCVCMLVTNTPIKFIKSFLEGTINILSIENCLHFLPHLT